MKKLLTICGAIVMLTISSAVVVTLGSHAVQPVPDATPLPPQTGVATTSSDAPEGVAKPKVQSYPVALRILSIRLHDPVVPVGVNDKGEMDVPSGTTKDIGWYRYGTVPGTVGSAVMDAHVYAAFNTLQQVRVGDMLDVSMSDGEVRRFRVYETRTYALSDVPAERLFNAADGAYLNLITCAGKLVPDHSTYDHRLIVYAALEE